MRYFIVVVAIFLTVGLAVSGQPRQAPAPVQTNGSAIFDRSCATCHKAGEKEVPAPELLRSPHAGGDCQRAHDRKDERSGRFALCCRACCGRAVPDRPCPPPLRREPVREPMHSA